MLVVSIASRIEGEKTAARRAFFGALILSTPFVALYLLDFPGKSGISLCLLGLIIIGSLVVLMPLPVRFRKSEETLDSKYDERDVIFVRNSLKKGDGKFEDYYNRRPEKLEPDNQFRSAPGLLSPLSSQADPFMFSSTAASFIACENLIEICDGPVGENRIQADPGDLSEYLKNWTKHLGAHSVGITLLKEDHKYSIGGRGDKYGNPVQNSHKFAVAFTVEMDFDSINQGPQAPAVMESARQYLNAGNIAVQVAAFIRNLGYSARAHIDAHYEVLCPTIARDAGLGELGRMGILMTPELGPRVRVNVVTTDIPLLIDKRQYRGYMIDFCRYCKKCAAVCPGRAISEEDREIHNGAFGWKINHEKCFNLWCKTGTDCGRCMAMCPFSHPHTVMHNIIRFFIRHSPVFRRIAASMDDLLYGRKPKPMELKPWQKVGLKSPDL